MARAIIERLLERDVLGVATTHYAELKAFAYATPGVTNGSVEFNVETLAPTYKLTIGLPGRSNALAIAARLGLDSTLIERTQHHGTRRCSGRGFCSLGIHHEREAAAADMQRAQELRDDAEKYRERLQEELRDFEVRRAAEWEAAQAQIESELREARSQVRRLRDEFRTDHFDASGWKMLRSGWKRREPRCQRCHSPVRVQRTSAITTTPPYSSQATRCWCAQYRAFGRGN